MRRASMLPRIALFMSLVVVFCDGASVHHTHAPKPTPSPTPDPITPEMIQQLETIENRVRSLTRQSMLQQLFFNERTRSDGDSGIKQVQELHDGSEPFYSYTHSSGSVGNIFDGSSRRRSVGIGGGIYVMNGNEFKMTPQSYGLKMPSRHSKTLHQVEDIPFPQVPPSVLKTNNITAQCDEMRQYFKAFHEQNTKIRDYRPYFKPVLCYLEGAWMNPKPHLSKRETEDSYRFNTFSEGNERHGDSFHPTTMINITEDGTPMFSKWQYRTLCHPLKTELKLQDLKLVDDLATRMDLNKTFQSFSMSRGARFAIAASHGYGYSKEDEYGHFRDASYGYGLLDRLMYEIPGKDNYHAYLEDNSFGNQALSLAFRNNTALNTAFYHRWYKESQAGAMGLLTRHRGYGDSNMWVAQTSHPEVAAMSLTEKRYNRTIHKNVYTTSTKRYTYAIPLEIIWLSPLYSWNPYNLAYFTDRHVPTNGGRKGHYDAHSAFNGTSEDKYYLTPAEFYYGDRANRSHAPKGVLDRNGTVRRVMASGTRTILNVPGVGHIRMRYPIMPVYAEGSTPWKELTALKDTVMDMAAHTNMFEFNPLKTTR